MRFSAVETLQGRVPSRFFKRALPLAEKLDAMIGGRDDAAQAQRTSLTAFAIRVASAAIAFLSQVLLARLMGTFEYGVFALVWVCVVIAGSLSCLGMQTAVIRFLPEYVKSGDMARLRGLLLTSRLFVLTSSTIVASLAAIAIYFASTAMESHYVVPFLIGVLAIPLISLADSLEGTARAHGWALRALSPTYIVRPALLFVFMLAAWLLGYPLTGVTAVLCAVAATYVTTIGQLFFITRDVDRVYTDTCTRKVSLQTWLTVALPIFLVEGFFFLLVNSDVLMVGLFMQPDDVAVYYATVKTMALVHFVYFAVKAGVAHRFAAEINNPDKGALRAFAQRSVAWTFWPSLALALFILATGPLLLAMFGSAFRDGYPLMFILAVGIVLRASVGPAESLLNMSGQQKACAIIYAAALFANIALNAALIPWLGLPGAALATASATVLEAVLLFVVTSKRLGVSMFVFAGNRASEKVH